MSKNCSKCRHPDAYRHQPGQPGDEPRDVPLCTKPRRMQCRWCRHFIVLPCERSMVSVCEPCGTRYRRRVQTVFLEGTRAEVLDRERSVMFVLTLTAPGRRAHRDLTKPGAPWCDCTPEGGVDLADWNGHQGERWNRFMQALRRSGLLGPDVQYGRAVETQQRGALHEHVLIRAAGVRRLSDVVEALRALAIEHDYGHELRIERAAVSQDGRARLAAWYAAKYVSKATDVREAIPWDRRPLKVDAGTGEVVKQSPATYRTWTASRGWGCSMKAVREAQRLWARSGLDILALATMTATSHPPPGPAQVVPVGGAPP